MGSHPSPVPWPNGSQAAEANPLFITTMSNLKTLGESLFFFTFSVALSTLTFCGLLGIDPTQANPTQPVPTSPKIQ